MMTCMTPLRARAGGVALLACLLSAASMTICSTRRETPPPSDETRPPLPPGDPYPPSPLNPPMRRAQFDRERRGSSRRGSAPAWPRGTSPVPVSSWKPSAPNGWGKTTLIAAVAGLIPFERGEILLNGAPLGQLNPWARRRRGLVTLPSDGRLFPSLRAGEILRLAQQSDESNDYALGPGRVCSSLSGGERRRLALLGMSQGAIGLCDEPFGALDQAAAQFAVARLLGLQNTLLITEPYRY